jgi:hypothetical protein
VHSRLKALTDTIDSRGWAVKNVNLNAYTVPVYVPAVSDRLLDPSSLPQVVPDSDIVAADDMMDERSNPIAQQFQSMIDQSAQTHRQDIVQRMNDTSAGRPAPVTPPVDNNYWFMNNASQSTPIQMAPAAAVIDPAEEAALAAKLRQSAAGPTPYSNLRTMKPTAAPQPAPVAATPIEPVVEPPTPAPPPMTAPADPAILSLAENDDLNVSTLAREAKRAKGEDGSQGEVVVPLR